MLILSFRNNSIADIKVRLTFPCNSWVWICRNRPCRAAVGEPGSQSVVGGGWGVGQGEEGDPLHRHPRPLPPPGQLQRGLGLLQRPPEVLRIRIQ